MRKIAFGLLAATAIGIAPALAQSATGNQSKQSAPPQSSHASGHDSQSGRPDTAAAPETTGSAGQTNSNVGEANRAIVEEAKKEKR